jgi:hypothetical protein
MLSSDSTILSMKNEDKHQQILPKGKAENSMKSAVLRHSVKHEQDKKEQYPSTGKLPSNMTHG